MFFISSLFEKNRISEILNKSSNQVKQKDVLLNFINKDMASEKKYSIDEEYFQFANNQKKSLIESICRKENINTDKFTELLDNFNFDKKTPLSDNVIDVLNTKPKLSDRKLITDKVIKKINEIDKLFN